MADDQLDDFLGFLEDDRLAIPHVPSTKYPRETGGHTYLVDQPDAKVGAQIAGLGEIMVKQAKGIEISERDIKRLQFSDDQEVEFGHQLLGNVYDEMIADGVNSLALKIATNYAFMTFAFSEDAARQMAKDGLLSGKPAAPANRAARRAKTTSPKASTRKATPRRK